MSKLMKQNNLEKLTPFERKNCYDCKYCQAALSWWCRNEDAVKYRGTSIPGTNFCKFWEVDWDYVDKKYKTPEFGYVYSSKEKLVMKINNLIKKMRDLFKAVVDAMNHND